MKINYITENAEALKAIQELNNFSKLCADTETTGLQASVTRRRLSRIGQSMYLIFLKHLFWLS